MIDKFIGFNRVIDGIITARLVITDVSDLVSLQTINRMTGSQIGNSYTRVGDVTNVSVFYPEAIVQGTTGVMTPTLPLSIITTDSAQHTTTLNTAIQIDNDPPVVVNGVTNAKVNGVITSIGANTPVTRTSDLDLHVGWTQLRDLVSVPLKTLEYTVQTVTDTQSLTTSVMLSNRSPAMLTREGSRIMPSLRLRDSIGNEGITGLPVVYVDSALTPDYTQIGTTNTVYRGWLANGCAVLGESATKGLQRFATTWDSQNLRINWQGADWNIDGDLFIYLDSIDGGTVQSYRPIKFTQTLSDSVALGDAFMTLPVNMAGRSIGLSSSASSWNNRLIHAQLQPRATTIQGADYVIHVQSNNTVTWLRWDSGTSTWVRQPTVPEFRYGVKDGISQTDLRIPFNQINYTIGQPFGIVAFATPKTTLMPWAVFPTTNPTRIDRGTAKIVLTPLLNAYSWTTLGDGVCPRRDAANPDTTQVVTSLTSNPAGSYQRTISDNFANTDPDAIANAIMQTQPMCAVLTTDNWCKTVGELADTTVAGSAILAGFANTLVNQQTPVVGDNSVVTYTLQIQNTSNRPTRPLYGIVRTYGGIWLTGTVNASASTGIISGNVYDYHSITNPNYYDYQVVKIDRIPANGSQSVTLLAKIDPRKAQPTDADRFKTSTVAKIEVRLTDDNSATALNSSVRTIEWLNAGIRIDTKAPTLIHVDDQQVIRTGYKVLTGSLRDDSAVPNVQLEYRFDSGTTSAMACGAAIAGLWRCGLTIPSTTTQLNYRVRAGDTYNQMSPWSAWYTAQIDRDKPTFQLDTASTGLLGASFVGGQTIQISGLVSDSSSTADMIVCDEQQANCKITPSTNQISTSTTYTTTIGNTMAITAQPCATTDIEAYTRYPISINSAGTSRIVSLTVNTTIAHGTANEVDLWLESPSGTRVALLNSDRNDGINIRASFADATMTNSTTLTGQQLLMPRLNSSNRRTACGFHRRTSKRNMDVACL
ncbi:MAG: hypothetical protein NT020_13235 [Chloroflexales bacterium]|nr:hypothetical protein [Chloroflexales bacterium]